MKYVHGESSPRTAEYDAWMNMHQRVAGTTSDRSRYIGRGITCCKRWQSYDNFLADMGRKPSAQHSLDRIDNDKGYSPKNCRWATKSEQIRNSTRTRMITFKGKTLCVTDWAAELGIPYGTLTARLSRGKSISEAFSK